MHSESPEVPTLVDVDAAIASLFENVRPLDTVQMPLAEATYRTLAEPVWCDTDHPPFDRSVMDGYAVRAADVEGAPVTLRLAGEIPAGSTATRSLAPGEAIQINTGAPIPPGADAVVRVEETESVEGNGVRVLRAVSIGNFITRRGEYARRGQVVLSTGSVLTPAAVGAAASAGQAAVTVYRKPNVAILSTGNELIDIGRVPTGSQIRNSNQYLLGALVESAHAGTVLLSTVRDDSEALRAKIEDAGSSDVLCVTGGASVGPLDLVPQVLEACGANFHFHKMAIKPGRPIHFATLPSGTLAFALPGNPVSAFVGFELLVRPALAALEGRPRAIPPLIRAKLEGNIPPTRARRTYIPARAWVDELGGWWSAPVEWQGSGDVLGLAAANALIVRPPDAAGVAQGEAVSMLWLHP